MGNEGPFQYALGKDGTIQIRMTTDLFGSEQAFVVDGTYVVKGDTMTLAIGNSTGYDLRRY